LRKLRLSCARVAFELERAKRLGSVQEFLKERDLQRDDWRRKSLNEEGTCRCGRASVRCRHYSVATRIGLEKPGAWRRNDGRITAAPLPRHLAFEVRLKLARTGTSSHKARTSKRGLEAYDKLELRFMELSCAARAAPMSLDEFVALSPRPRHLTDGWMS
jgi:hypothetical protein